MPNLIFYNWACHAHHFWLWLYTYLRRETCIDYWVCSPHSPWDLVTCDAIKINLKLKHNLVIYNSIRVWRDITKHLGRKNVKSSLSPTVQYPDFAAGPGSSVLSSWRDKGIHVIGDLFKDNTLLSLQQLQEIFDIPKQHFFGYLQMRHLIVSQVTSFSEKFILECQNGISYHHFVHFSVPQTHMSCQIFLVNGKETLVLNIVKTTID